MPTTGIRTTVVVVVVLLLLFINTSGYANTTGIRTTVVVVVVLLLFINTSGYANTTGIRITVLVVVVALFVLWLLLFWLRILPVYVSTTGFCCWCCCFVLLLFWLLILPVVPILLVCLNTTGLYPSYRFCCCVCFVVLVINTTGCTNTTSLCQCR